MSTSVFHILSCRGFVIVSPEGRVVFVVYFSNRYVLILPLRIIFAARVLALRLSRLRMVVARAVLPLARSPPTALFLFPLPVPISSLSCLPLLFQYVSFLYNKFVISLCPPK